MELSLHTLRPFAASGKKRKRVGRGHGSAHGSYSTRGVKGQRSRSGGSKGLYLKGLKPILLQTPKLRGFKSIHAKAIGINLELLEKHFSNGDHVTLKTLRERGLINVREGAKAKVKILGSGKLSKKLTIEGCAVSASARAQIEKAGGSIVPLALPVLRKKKK